MEKDGRPVLRAPVRPLAVELRGIMVLPEDFQEVFVANLRGIIVDFDRLGVTGAVGANLLIGRIVGVAAAVAYAG